VHRGSQTGVGGRKFADLGHVEGGVRGILAVSGQPSASFELAMPKRAIAFAAYFPPAGWFRRREATRRDKKLNADR
jgi:hypothetical protein